MSASWPLQRIGVVHSPYADKFGVPRQPGLAPTVEATLELLPPYNRPEAVRGLEGFSHLWLIFAFHQTAAAGWQPTVRPPRLGGNRRVGVFATRATHRPNPLGLSVVELIGIDCQGGVRLRLRGADLVDGTPVLDIKPYIPFVDSRPHARTGFIDGPPPCLPVQFAPQLVEQLAEQPALRQAIVEVLQQDPRPAYAAISARRYGVRLYQYDVRFERCAEHILVHELVALP